jgi:hypothetical protein
LLSGQRRLGGAVDHRAPDAPGLRADGLGQRGALSQGRQRARLVRAARGFDVQLVADEREPEHLLQAVFGSPRECGSGHLAPERGYPVVDTDADPLAGQGRVLEEGLPGPQR